MAGEPRNGWESAGKGAVEAYPRLDASYLQRLGIFEDGRTATAQMTSVDLAMLEVVLRGAPDGVQVTFERAGSDEGAEWLAIDWTDRHFGGREAYFVCPACGERCRHLVLKDVQFRCRTCHGLKHSSTRERIQDRACRKAAKLRKRLGSETGPFAALPDRPKGMHASTYDRLIHRLQQAERVALDEMVALLAGLERHMAQSDPFW